MTDDESRELARLRRRVTELRLHKDILTEALSRIVDRACSDDEDDHYSDSFEGDFAYAALVLDPDTKEATHGVRRIEG